MDSSQELAQNISDDLLEEFRRRHPTATGRRPQGPKPRGRKRLKSPQRIQELQQPSVPRPQRHQARPSYLDYIVTFLWPEYKQIVTASLVEIGEPAFHIAWRWCPQALQQLAILRAQQQPSRSWGDCGCRISNQTLYTYYNEQTSTLRIYSISSGYPCSWYRETFRRLLILFDSQVHNVLCMSSEQLA